MKNSSRALRGKYFLFIVSIVLILVTTQIVIQYDLGQHSDGDPDTTNKHQRTLSLILTGFAIVILVLEFMYIFLPAFYRLNSVNRKLMVLKDNLEQRERQYRELVEDATDIIYELNSNGEFEYANKLMENLSGYARAEIIGRPYQDLIHYEDREEAIKFYRQQGKNKTEISYLEFRMLTKDGRSIWIGQNVKFFFNGDWVTKVRVVARNITQLRQAQLAMQRLKDQAEHATLAKSQFLSMMSHEIRTPMNAIIGLTNLLLDQNPTKEQLSNLKLLKFSGENLLTIINDILDFSKIEAQKIQLESIDMDIRQLIDQTIKIHKIKAIEKGITLSCTISQDMPQYLKGDPVRLIQIITNLITNAIKFTESGTVTLTVDKISEYDKVISFQTTINDTGIGIAADKIETIFESFSQAEDATTRKFGGTGLGLAITKKLIELMHGQIEVKSIPDKGSSFSFTLTLPIGREPAVEYSFEPSTHIIGKDVHLLLVEDNVTNQLVITAFLQKWNVRVTLACNGKEALQKIQSKTFDLVLMDLQMPEMSGYEASEAIRSMPDAYFKTVPIIALTASAMTEVKDKSYAVGMNDFISKPFQPHELWQIINKFTGTESLQKSSDNKLIPSDLAAQDAELYMSLIEAATENLQELLSAFDRSLKEHNPVLFQTAAHKSKMALAFLNDSELEQRTEEFSVFFKQNKSIPESLQQEYKHLLGIAIESSKMILKNSMHN